MQFYQYQLEVCPFPSQFASSESQLTHLESSWSNLRKAGVSLS